MVRKSRSMLVRKLRDEDEAKSEIARVMQEAGHDDYSVPVSFSPSEVMEVAEAYHDSIERARRARRSTVRLT